MNAALAAAEPQPVAQGAATDVFVYRHFGLLICFGLVYGPCGLASVVAKYMLPRSLPPSYIDSFMLEDLVPSTGCFTARY
jgi:hypothetical protein